MGDDVRTDGGAAAAAGVPFCWIDRGGLGRAPPAAAPGSRTCASLLPSSVWKRGSRGDRTVPL